jgi:hypothetical protein
MWSRLPGRHALHATRQRLAPVAAATLTALAEVAGHVRRGAERLTDGHHAFQGHVFRSGDLLASWAVEDAVHLLDLDVGVAPPEEALRLARATVQALLGRPLPAGWSDTEAVLVATGRTPLPRGHEDLAPDLPALG